MRPLKNPEKQELFDLWMSALFDHPDSHIDWRWEDGNDVDELVPLDDETTLEFMQHLFRHSGHLLETNSDQQVVLGIDYLCNNAISDYMYLTEEPKLPLEKRLAVVESIYFVFQDVFETRCRRELASNSESDFTKIDLVCYMYWEVCAAGFPLFREDCDPKYAAVILDLMERCLTLKNPACIESALHGLGHLVDYNNQARVVIEKFIRNNPNADIAILNYAEAAKTGCIQ